MTYEFPRNLRYSPVNFLIVNWGHNGMAFNDCGLPKPQPCKEGTHPRPPCNPLPIQEAIDTVGWAKWLPEVIIGVEDPDEEIAASYVRESAIEFAKYTRCLQRQILIPLQPGIDSYPIEPYDQEQVIGLLGAGLDKNPAVPSSGVGRTVDLNHDLRVSLDTARNEIHLISRRSPCWDYGVLRLLVWSAPTEEACDHDTFLYDRFRRDITVGARFNYVSALHFRDKELLHVVTRNNDFETRKALAKGKVMSRNSGQKQHFGTAWAGRGAF